MDMTALALPDLAAVEAAAGRLAGQAIETPLTLDYIAVSSYGAATKSSGEVKLVKDVDQSLDGRDLLGVEDIVDTGLTLSYLLEILQARNPASLKTASA